MYSLMLWVAVAFNTIMLERKYAWVELDTFESLMIEGVKLNPIDHCKYIAMQLNLKKYKYLLRT